MAARARLALLGRSKWPLELARLSQGARNCLAWLLENTALADVSDFEPLGSFGALDIVSGARSAPLGRPKCKIRYGRHAKRKPKRNKEMENERNKG